MRWVLWGLVAAICFGLVGPARAKAPESIVPPSLEGVVWNGQGIALDMLRGKTVVVLVYATWCPICNKWSGELFSQLKETTTDKPIVILAINADSRKKPSMTYVTERGFLAPNILHGYDPTMVGRLGFKSDLFYYALIDPGGKLRETGYAGSFFETPQGRRFALPEKLSELKESGRFVVLDPDLPAEAKALLWPMELGYPVSAKQLGQASRRLDVETRAKLDAAVANYLDGELARIKELDSGDVAQRLRAYEKADRLATRFRSEQQGREAKDIVTAMNKDREFRRELAAKKYYDKASERAAADPAQREGLLRSLTNRFEGTYHAQKAAEQLDAIQ